MPDAPPVAGLDRCDLSACDPRTATLLSSYFSAKNAHDAAGMAAHFNTDHTVYGDAVLGWVFPSHQEFRKILDHITPNWPEAARSYPTRVIGSGTGAMVFVTDTPEMFGGEIRGIAAVDIADGQCVRWIDYWDARGFGRQSAAGMRTPQAEFPGDFGEQTVSSAGPGRITSVCQDLHAALTDGDGDRAGRVFAEDAVFEDMTLRTAVRGRAAIGRYLARAAGDLPYGPGARLRHILGGDLGGGYEWSSHDPSVLYGVTAIELDGNLITSATTSWDGSVLSDERLATLSAHAFDRVP
jgi:hypothetical protein